MRQPPSKRLGDEHVERRVRAYIRWNAAVMVSRANRCEFAVGVHIATYASAASLYEVAFNHFFLGKSDGAARWIGFATRHQGWRYSGILQVGWLSDERAWHFRR